MLWHGQKHQQEGEVEEEEEEEEKSQGGGRRGMPRHGKTSNEPAAAANKSGWTYVLHE
jgi:hypothetical protein